MKKQNIVCFKTLISYDKYLRPGGVLQFFAVDVHFSLYGGWVTVASIVNSAAIAINSIVDADSSTESTCSVVMLLVALLLNTILAVTRQDCVWPGVLAWASGFIDAAHQEGPAVTSSVVDVCILSGIVSVGGRAVYYYYVGKG